MNYEEFLKTLDFESPPPEIKGPLLALWHAKIGDWAQAHEIAQASDDTASAWVHAYLHRVEGDISNAAYWYRNAGLPVCIADLESEWEQITRQLVGSNPKSPENTR